MTSEEKRPPPVIVASFAEEEALWEGVRALHERRVLSDFVGAYLGEDPTDITGRRHLYLLSVLAPRRLLEELGEAMRGCGASEVGTVEAFRRRYGFVPHPGALDYNDMRLPMGQEYPLNLAGRRRS